MPGPWRRRSVLNRTHCADISISDEVPGPWRPSSDVFLTFDVSSFQSQTRCQAPGDHEHDRYAEHDHKISISDEMPGPWRPQHPFAGCLCARYFNLRRDARPLATSSRRNTCDASRYISISDEKPGPWRRLSLTQQPDGDTIFQSQTR